MVILRWAASGIQGLPLVSNECVSETVRHGVPCPDAKIEPLGERGAGAVGGGWPVQSCHRLEPPQTAAASHRRLAIPITTSTSVRHT